MKCTAKVFKFYIVCGQREYHNIRGFFNKPIRHEPSYCYISEFFSISQYAMRQTTGLSQSFFKKPIRHAPNHWSISEFFQSANTPCAKLLVYLRVFSISQYAMRHGTEREIVTISLFFAWYFVIAPPAFAVYIDK